MRSVALFALPILVLCADISLKDNTTSLGHPKSQRYGFYRMMTWGQERLHKNRLFDHVTGNLTEFPAACILSDEYFSPRCSAAILTPRWAVTAGHCTTLSVAFLVYNAQRPSSLEGHIVKVLHVYRHPQYEVEERDDDLGFGVSILIHDIGLVYVENNMRLNSKLQEDPLLAMKMYKPAEMTEHELQVMGFAHTSSLTTSEELFSVKMRMVNCSSLHWLHCICGVPSRPGRNGEVSVCNADSGGPVLYRGVQVAVTSMGPMECTSPNMQPPAFATSVFTVLYPYADLINDTIYNSRHGMQMVMLSDDNGCAFIKSKLSDIVISLVVCFCICLRCG